MKRFIAGVMSVLLAGTAGREFDTRSMAQPRVPTLIEIKLIASTWR
jgi:hypothetical protein